MTNISKRHNDEELIEILKDEIKEYGYNEDESKVIVDFATRNRTFDIAKIALNYLYGSNGQFDYSYQKQRHSQTLQPPQTLRKDTNGSRSAQNNGSGSLIFQ